MQPGVNNPRLKMNPKTKRKPETNKTASDSPVSHHLHKLHEFVEHIMVYAEEPSSWPLTQQEQIAFVRTVIYQAKKLRKSEGYITVSVSLAAERLALAA